MIIDTHTHLDNEKYYNDVDEVIARAKKNGVTKFIIPGANPKDLPKAIELSDKYEEVYFAVGIHPIDLDNYDDKYLLDFINHPKCVAVGEIGLDYYWEKEQTKKERQKKYFIKQLQIALTYKKPVIVHIREASEDSLEILMKFTKENPNLKGVLHCFNANSQLLKLQDNFYYGIGGVITFKNAKKLVNIFPKIPKNKVIIETDSPYLTPHPHRGERNEPLFTILVRDKIAELWNTKNEDVDSTTTQNAKELFNI